MRIAPVDSITSLAVLARLFAEVVEDPVHRVVGPGDEAVE
jgi:hypothetical protein